MAKREHNIQNEIRLWCGQNDILCFRCNVGKVRTETGVYFDTGLPPGFSDLLILHNGKCIFCEVKTAIGKLRPDQINFRDTVISHGFTYVVARSVDDIKRVIYQP